MPKNRDKRHRGLPGQEESIYSLEEILAEYRASGSASSAAAPPTPPEQSNAAAAKEAPLPQAEERRNLLSFTMDAKAADKSEQKSPQANPATPEPPHTEREPVLPHFLSGTGLEAGVRQILHRAETYAENMFAEEGREFDTGTRLAETLIPGVDVEEAPDPLPEKPAGRMRKKTAPPPPDTPPDILYERYGKNLRLLALRTFLLFCLAVPALYLAAAPSLLLPLPNALSLLFPLQAYLSALLLGLSMLLSCDILLRGLLDPFRLLIGTETLLLVSSFAALADALAVAGTGAQAGRLPYCAVVIFALGFAALGQKLKQQANRLSSKIAASTAEPYQVISDRKWNGKPAYTKFSAPLSGFGRQIQSEDGAQLLKRKVLPLLFLAGILFSVLSSFGQERPEKFLWCLSAILASISSFSGALTYSMPFSQTAKRLSSVGASAAGWPGILNGRKTRSILLTDSDLFPPGSVTLNGIKIFGDSSSQKVIGCAASLIRETGSGLDHVFSRLAHEQGALYRKVSRLSYCDGNGIAAEMRNEQVLLGPLSFMRLMEVKLPEGIHIKHAVFCAIDGELAGVFALHYALSDGIRFAIAALLRNQICPILATRDCNLIPTMLSEGFELPMERFQFPPIGRRVELSAPPVSSSSLLTAVLCREGLVPFSSAIIGAKRLSFCVYAGTLLALVGSCIGLLLTFYLTFVDAYSSLSCFNLFIFMLMWLVPTLALSDWATRY